MGMWDTAPRTMSQVLAKFQDPLWFKDPSCIKECLLNCGYWLIHSYIYIRKKISEEYTRIYGYLLLGKVGRWGSGHRGKIFTTLFKIFFKFWNNLKSILDKMATSCKYGKNTSFSHPFESKLLLWCPHQSLISLVWISSKDLVWQLQHTQQSQEINNTDACPPVKLHLQSQQCPL